MKLSDYATKNRTGGFYNGTVQAAYLNNLSVPDASLICQHQKEMFKSTFDVQQSNVPEELQNFLKIEGIPTSGFNFIDEVISKIEGYVNALSSGSVAEIIEKAQKEGLYDSARGNFQTFLQECRDFFNGLRELKNMQSVIKAFKSLEQHLNEIQESIEKNGETAPFQFKNKIRWTEYHIKGQYLEAAALDWLLSVFPNNIVVNTGQLYGTYDIFGGFSQRQMKEDLMILDSDNFTVSYTIGKDQTVVTCTMREFLTNIHNSSQSIHLTEAGYEELQRHMIAGVQSKATRLDTIRWGAISIAGAGSPFSQTLDSALMTLQDIYFAASKGKRVTSSTSVLMNKNDDYKALFNYSLARHLSFLIGENNRILVTRYGLSDLYNEILRSFNEGKGLYGVGDINLSNRRVIKVKQDLNLTQ